MDSIRFAENLIALRREKKVTQEQLADFCGVTKASVSKWETRQTMPDALLFPRLAAFFGITIDELFGYEICLSKEQIQKVYEELAADFAAKAFDVAMSKCREYVKQYYSCYELLEKIVLIWMNHYMFAGDKQADILLEAKTLCDRILDGSRDIGLCNDVIFLKTMIDLQLGNALEVTETLEDMCHPHRLSTKSENILLSAYIQTGMLEKGNDFSQIMMYSHLEALIEDAGAFLTIHKDDLKKCEKTLKRIEKVVDAFDIDKINFNLVAVFHYQVARIYCLHGEKEKGFEQFKHYAELTLRFLQGNKEYFCCDDYFDRLDVWIEGNILGGQLPRGKKVVLDSLRMSFDSPEFAILQGEKEFQTLRKRVENMNIL